MSINIAHKEQRNHKTCWNISTSSRIVNLSNLDNGRIDSRKINENKNNKARFHNN